MQSKEKKINNTVSKELFRELALKNVKKSSRDYLIYFLTLAFSVALFYTFNSIEAQFQAFQIPDRLNFLSFSTGMLAGISLLECLIIGFLVVYANRFMLRRRKREMGVYMTLGMEFEDISALLWRETLMIGSAALIAGLVTGIILSQGLSLVTAKIIGAKLMDYRFVLSIKAVVASVLFFCVMFFFVYRLNVREIRKMELLELLYAGRKNELVSGGRIRDIVIFILAAVMLIVGYGVIAVPNKKHFAQGLFAGIGFIGAGSILLCLCISTVLVRICKRRKGYYYSRLRLFAVNQLGSRLKSAGVSIGVVSILICLSISAIMIGLGTGKTFVSDAEGVAPFDVSFFVREDTESLGNMTLEEFLETKGLSLSRYVKESAELRIYTSDAITQDLFNVSGSDSKGKAYKVYIVGVDDYNTVMSLKGIPPVSLGENEYAVNFDVEEKTKELEEFMGRGMGLDLNGSMLTPAEDGLYSRTYSNGNGFADIGTLIVPQKLTEGLTLMQTVCNGSFRNPNSYRELDEDYLKLPVRIIFQTHEDIKIELMSSILTVTYIGMYLGITFLIVAGAVLALQQLTQAADNVHRYGLLRKLGASEEDMREALRMQLVVYFGVPFVLAVLNAVFIVAGVFVDAGELGLWSILRPGLLTAVMVILVYGLYFVVTYAGSKRILMQNHSISAENL